MSDNPIETHFVLQAIVVLIISMAMLYTGQVAGTYFSSFDVLYAEQIGFVVGATLIFAPFTVLYKYYDASTGNDG